MTIATFDSPARPTPARAARAKAVSSPSPMATAGADGGSPGTPLGRWTRLWDRWRRRTPRHRGDLRISISLSGQVPSMVAVPFIDSSDEDDTRRWR